MIEVFNMTKWMKFIYWKENKAIFRKATLLEVIKDKLYFKEDNILLDFDECDRILKGG